MLTAIKLAHTLIWAILAACILVLPVLALRGRFKWAVVLSAIVLIECGVIALNGGRCPLTDVAAHYTEDRKDNFDIYLPISLARHNKAIFGALFIAGEMVLLWSWRRHSVVQ
jgi:hypothetical protein